MGMGMVQVWGARVAREHIDLVSFMYVFRRVTDRVALLTYSWSGHTDQLPDKLVAISNTCDPRADISHALATISAQFIYGASLLPGSSEQMKRVLHLRLRLVLSARQPCIVIVMEYERTKLANPDPRTSLVASFHILDTSSRLPRPTLCI